MLKPIETFYKGYRFRSRLEARWAVFFDALGLQWEYEPEGFETAAGRYLPDFRIRGNDGRSRYVEIKPPGIPSVAEVKKALGLCIELLRARELPVVVVACGDPFEADAVACAAGPGGFSTHHINAAALAAAWAGLSGAEPEEVVRSAISARQARFEHGEAPR